MYAIPQWPNLISDKCNAALKSMRLDAILLISPRISVIKFVCALNCCLSLFINVLCLRQGI